MSRFVVTVSHKQMGQKKFKKVKKVYLSSGETYGEVEKNTYEQEFSKETEFKIEDIKRLKVADYIKGERSNKWFIVRVCIGVIKKKYCNYIVLSENKLTAIGDVEKYTNCSIKSIREVDFEDEF